MKKVSWDKNLLVVVSDKSDGNFSYKYGDKGEVNKDKQEFFKVYDLDSRQVVEVEQVHGSGVVVVGKGDAGITVPKMDGLVTDDKEVSLMLKIGDCIPVVIYDPKNHATGLFHSGWRGTIEKIFLHGLVKLGNEYGTSPGEVKVWLGPSIQKCCYVADKPPTQRVLPEWNQFIEKKDGKWLVDMVAFTRKTLVDIGVQEDRIISSGECTFHNKEDWFSFARHKETGEQDGRFAVVVKLL